MPRQASLMSECFGLRLAFLFPTRMKVMVAKRVHDSQAEAGWSQPRGRYSLVQPFIYEHRGLVSIVAVQRAA